MDGEHARPLLDSDQASWVTLTRESQDDENNSSSLDGDGGGWESSSAWQKSSPWDQASSATRGSWSGAKSNRGKNNESTTFITLLRVGNMIAAALLIYGSVRID